MYSQLPRDTLFAHTHFIKGDSLLKKRDYTRALRYFRLSEEHFKEKECWQRQAECLLKITDIRYQQNNFDNVLFLADEVLEISHNYLDKETLVEAGAITFKGKAYKRKNQFNEAVKSYKKALSITRNQVGLYHVETGILEILLGIAYDDWGFSEDAQKHYEIALRINQKLYEEGKDNQLNTSHLNLAVLYSRIGLYKQSIPYYKKAIALDIEKYGEKDPYLAESYYNLGTNYSKIGEDNVSLQYYNKALHICQENLKEGDEYFAVLYTGIATQYTKLEKADKALEMYFKSLEIYKNIYGQSHLYIAEVLGNIGGTYRILERYEEALRFLKKAEHITVSLFDRKHRNLFAIYDELGQLYEKQYRFDTAKDYYQKKLEIALQNFGARNQNTAEAYIDIARIHVSNQMYREAISNYHKALISGSKKFNNPQINSYPEVADYVNGRTQLTAMYGKAKALKTEPEIQTDITNLKLAYEHFFVCDAILDQTRLSYQSTEDKMSLEQNAKNVYRDAIEVALVLHEKTKDTKYLEDAFYFSEKNKSRLLDEQLRKTKATRFAGIPSEEIKELEEVKTKLAKYTSKLYEYKGGVNNIDTTIVHKYSDLVFLYHQKNDSITKELAQKYPKYYSLVYDHTIISANEIQQKLPERTAFIEYFTSDSKSYFFYISKNEFSVHSFAADNLEQKVIGFRKAIIRNKIDQFSAIGHELYQDLIAPVILNRNIENLVIIPSGILWHLNFDLLVTEPSNSKSAQDISYLLKEKVISYANSAALFFSDNHQKQPIREECLAFSFSGDTTSSSVSLSTLRNAREDLPGARKEIKAISEIVGGKYFYGKESIEANFKKFSNQYDILHLAIHGELDDNHPENSRLFFTQDSLSTEDNYLYNQEIYNLKIPASLVVLSACNTGSGKISKGEGVMSMGRAFQYAGARSLLLTSWEVSDESTPVIMKNFYKNLSGGMNKAKALQQAKLQFLENTDVYQTGPLHWGGFYVLGDISEIEFSGNRYLNVYLIVVILILLLIGGRLFYVKKKKQV